MNEATLEELRRLMRTGFTGRVELHFQNGAIRACEKIERWKPRGPEQIDEVGDGLRAS